jgi:hypothetical protein
MANADRRRLLEKSGSLMPVSFTGTPKVASVVFASPFAASYSVVAEVVSSGGRAYAYSITNVTPSGFFVELCADTISSLVQVNWQATVEGEE